MGKYQGRIAGDIIAGIEARDRSSVSAVPRVTFTDPQVTAVGRTEADVKGTSQLVVDDDRRVIVGATFTGPGVADLLHSATIAIVGEVPLDTLWHAVPSFPTISEVWLRLLETYGL